MRRIWQHHPFLVLSFVLAAALTLFFAGRLVRQTLYWSDPAHHQEQVQGWMTPRYIAKSWHLPAAEIEAALGMAPSQRPQPLSEIAATRGIPEAQLIGEVQAAIANFAAKAH
ncbi:hypothetical protein [Cypionkella sp.]|uniref:hypothetical protein n=1 Tax=Cypionkella sp. TaxID=2811411 RepID=UPI003752106D